MLEVTLSTKLCWEFGKTISRIHLDTIIISTRSVGWLEGAVMGRAVESDELKEAISDTTEHAAAPVNKTKRPASLSAISGRLTDDLLRHFHDTVNEVTQSAAELAGGIKFGSRRSLNVCHHGSSHS